MISISTQIADESGNVIIDNRFAEPETLQARVTRHKTLDGGIVVVKSGFTHGDRTKKISAEMTESDALLLESVIWNNTGLTLSDKTGFYAVVPESFQNKNGHR